MKTGPAEILFSKELYISLSLNKARETFSKDLNIEIIDKPDYYKVVIKELHSIDDSVIDEFKNYILFETIINPK